MPARAKNGNVLHVGVNGGGKGVKRSGVRTVQHTTTVWQVKKSVESERCTIEEVQEVGACSDGDVGVHGKRSGAWSDGDDGVHDKRSDARRKWRIKVWRVSSACARVVVKMRVLSQWQMAESALLHNGAVYEIDPVGVSDECERECVSASDGAVPTALSVSMSPLHSYSEGQPDEVEEACCGGGRALVVASEGSTSAIGTSPSEWWQRVSGDSNVLGDARALLTESAGDDAVTTKSWREEFEARVLGEEEVEVCAVGRSDARRVSLKLMVEYVWCMHLRLLHAGRDVLMATIRRHFVVPGLADMVRYVCEQCLTCPLTAVSKGLKGMDRGEVAIAPNERLHVDTGDMCVVCELPDQQLKGKHLLQARVDAFSGFIGVSIVSSTGGKEAWDTVYRDHIQVFGKPAVIHGDGGSELGSEYFKGQCARHEIKWVQNPSASSRSNGKVERVFSELWHGFRCVMADFDIIPSQVLAVVQCVVGALNERCRADGSASRSEKFFRMVPISSTDHALHRLIYAPPSRMLSAEHVFQVGEKVLFDHPENAFGKGASVGKKCSVFPVECVVVSRSSETVYVLRSLEKLHVGRTGADGMSRTWLATVDHMRKSRVPSSFLPPIGSVMSERGRARQTAVMPAAGPNTTNDVGPLVGALRMAREAIVLSASGDRPKMQRAVASRARGQTGNMRGVHASTAGTLLGPLQPKATTVSVVPGGPAGSVVPGGQTVSVVPGGPVVSVVPGGPEVSVGPGVPLVPGDGMAEPVADIDMRGVHVDSSRAPTTDGLRQKWSKYEGRLVIHRRRYPQADRLEVGRVLRLDDERQCLIVHEYATVNPTRATLKKRGFAPVWLLHGPRRLTQVCTSQPPESDALEYAVPITAVLDLAPFDLTSMRQLPAGVVQLISSSVDGFAFLAVGKKMNEVKVDDDACGFVMHVCADDEVVNAGKTAAQLVWDNDAWVAKLKAMSSEPLAFDMEMGLFTLGGEEIDLDRALIGKLGDELGLDDNELEGLLDEPDFCKGLREEHGLDEPADVMMAMFHTSDEDRAERASTEVGSPRSSSEFTDVMTMFGGWADPTISEGDDDDDEEMIGDMLESVKDSVRGVKRAKPYASGETVSATCASVDEACVPEAVLHASVDESTRVVEMDDADAISAREQRRMELGDDDEVVYFTTVAMEAHMEALERQRRTVTMLARQRQRPGQKVPRAGTPRLPSVSIRRAGGVRLLGVKGRPGRCGDEVRLPRIMAYVAAAVPEGIVGEAKKVVMKDLTDDQRRQVIAARVKEMGQMKHYHVLAPTTQEEATANGAARPLSTKFIYEFKMTDGVVGIKARLVAEGMKKLDRRVGVDVVTGMPHSRALMFLFAWVTRQPGYCKESVLTADVKTAFLQSPMTTPVLVRKPRDLLPNEEGGMFGPEGLAWAVQALYGTREAPREWEKYFLSIVTKLGYVRSRCHPGVYIRYVVKEDGRKEVEAVLFVHVDDIIAFGLPNAHAVMAELRAKVDFKAAPAVPTRVLGFDVRVTDDDIVVDQHVHAEALPVRVQHGKKYAKPLPGTLRGEQQSVNVPFEADVPCTDDEHAVYRKIQGILLFLRHTRPDILYALSYLGRGLKAPTRRDLRMLGHTARYVKSTARCGLRFTTAATAMKEGRDSPCDHALYRELGGPRVQAEGGTVHAMDAYADASLMLVGQSGFLITMDGMVVCASSSKQRKRATNTTKAESEATHDALDVVIVLLVFAQELGCDVRPCIWIDPLNLVRLIGSFHANPSEESLRPQLIAMQQLLDGDIAGRLLRARACRDQGVLVASDREWAAFEAQLGKEAATRARKPHAEALLGFRSVLALHDKLDEVYDLTAIPTTRIQLRHIPGPKNPADGLTKPMSVDAIAAFMFKGAASVLVEGVDLIPEHVHGNEVDDDEAFDGVDDADDDAVAHVAAVVTEAWHDDVWPRVMMMLEENRAWRLQRLSWEQGPLRLLDRCEVAESPAGFARLGAECRLANAVAAWGRVPTAVDSRDEASVRAVAVGDELAALPVAHSSASQCAECDTPMFGAARFVVWEMYPMK